MTITPAQQDAMERLLANKALPFKGKKINQVAGELCEMFAEDEVQISGSCAKSLIRSAIKSGYLKWDEGTLRTLTAAERHELDKTRRKSRRGTKNNAVPVYRNDSRVAA